MCVLIPCARTYILFTGDMFESEEERVPVSARARSAGKTKLAASRGKALVQGGTSRGAPAAQSKRARRNPAEPTCNDWKKLAIHDFT
jgi:hypothetical protein